MTSPKPGVLHRHKSQGEIPDRQHISLLVKPIRDRGQFIVDAVFDANREALDRKYLANRLRQR